MLPLCPAAFPEHRWRRHGHPPPTLASGLSYTEGMVVTSDPEVMWGTPVFAGTRVPAATLADYLAAGDTLDAFLSDYPEVTQAHAEAFLRESAEGFIRDELRAA